MITQPSTNHIKPVHCNVDQSTLMNYFVLLLFCFAKHCCPPGGGGKPLIVAVVTKAGAGQSTLSVLSSPTQPIPFVLAQIIIFPKFFLAVFPKYFLIVFP